MNSIYDYKRFAILYVDDEEKSLKYFARAFADTFRVLTATNAADGYQLLLDHQDEIGVVMSDQRMPGEQGVQFLEKARRLQPRVIRILATAFTDLDAAIAAVNTGAIYKYVTKPWDIPLLENTLKRSLEFFIVQLERDLLLREKLSSLHRMLIADRILSLGVLAAGLNNQLRNSLDAVHKFLDLAPEMLQRENVDLEQLRNPNFWQEFHRHVQSQVKTVLGLMHGLSEETKQPFRFDTEMRVQASLEEALQAVGPELAARGIRVHNEVPPDLPALRVDRTRFHKLFELLLRDALLRLESNAEIRFQATFRPGAGDSVDEVEITIQDSGPGLPPETVLSVLDPLIAREDKAADLGLHLMACYFIVYHHGGRIGLRSGGEAGTCLTLTLPLQPPASVTPVESEEFLVRAMTNERLWERLLAGA
ncbi:MAG: response regulator [Verrucomicrobiales bacterium]|nr:response regulator [Verrucomicrobiales bacterium]